MEREDKELIDHLAEKLQSHELPYKEGAWEQFMQYEQSRQFPVRSKRILAPWLVAAACIAVLALGGIYYFQKQSAVDSVTDRVTNTALAPTHPSNPNNEQRNTTENSKDNNQAHPLDNTTDDAESLAKQNQNDLNNLGQGNYSTVNPGNFSNVPSQPDIQPADNNDFQQVQIDNQGIVRLSGEPVNKRANITQQKYNLLSGIDRLLPNSAMNLNKQRPQQVMSSDLAKNNNLAGAQNSAQKNQRPPEKPVEDPGLKRAASSFDNNGYFDPNAPENAGNKWALGVMVIPGMGNDSKLNLGYGVSVGYRLSNRFSVNSGVSYNELSGTRNEKNQSSIAASGSRLLSSIDANVTGLNVPIELRYNVSKKIYVGAGVSALAVLSNKVVRNYAVSQMQTSAFEAKNGHQLKPDEMKSIAATLTTQENIPEAQIDSKNFAGFMNFTFGFQQKLNKTKSLSIEPYISVPMSNNLSNQHIRLTDGGIRIKLGL